MDLFKESKWSSWKRSNNGLLDFNLVYFNENLFNFITIKFFLSFFSIIKYQELIPVIAVKGTGFCKIGSNLLFKFFIL